jgi:hypothetical protein
MTLESLVAEFAECAAGQYDAIMAGDPDLGNRYSARYIAAFKELRSHGEPGLNALTRLLIGQLTSDDLFEISPLAKVWVPWRLNACTSLNAGGSQSKSVRPLSSGFGDDA